ncbi:MAG: tetraacyldisaccharide 4'-kinase [Blastocatellia bacterium]
MTPITNPLLRALLYLPARLYETGVRWRPALYERGVFATKHLSAPVISVGNLSVGGTGKTPLTAFITRFLTSAIAQTGGAPDSQVAILSRGYRRQGKGLVEVSNGRATMAGAARAGDEPWLLAQLCPGARVVVHTDRYTAGRWLEQRAPIYAFVLDDGFQHLRLARDLNLLLLDGAEPPDQTALIPWGRLREPLSAIARADAVIITRAHDIDARGPDRAIWRQQLARHTPVETPVFFAAHHLSGLRRAGTGAMTNIGALAGRNILAFSGIARPGRFFADLERAGMTVAMRREFRDHHRYTDTEIAQLLAAAQKAGVTAIVTTEKDMANCSNAITQTMRDHSLPVYAAQLQFVCEQETELKNLILECMQRKGRR